MTDTTADQPTSYEDDADRNVPCGESGCLCYGVGEEHAECACGCDCPRCSGCQQLPENCDCDD